MGWATIFLGPSLAGFLLFLAVPLGISFAMAFTNWDLRLHNLFRTEPLRFVGLQNFSRLMREPELWRHLGNTLYLMLGIPFAMAGSLLLAVTLAGNLRGRRRGTRAGLLVLATSASGCLIAVSMLNGAGMILLMCGLFSVIFIGGVSGGSGLYRTLCYLPSFTSGVAVYLLWKKLFAPSHGPINSVLEAPLQYLQLLATSAPLLIRAGAVALLALAELLLIYGMRRVRSSWRDGEWALGTTVLVALSLVLPATLSWRVLPWDLAICVLIASPVLLGCFAGGRWGRPFRGVDRAGVVSAVCLGILLMCAQLTLYALAAVIWSLPRLATTEAFHPPAWLASVTWAKPAIMIATFWGAIGSNNMLLYLAGLSGISPELYEAADIDGASSWQRFLNVTWPQLAPTTFFIAIMSVIAGLQGGFEMVQAMTQGGPAGATTTLSYFIYMEGFQTGRLGYSSAIAWFLFAVVLVVTLFGWKFGSTYAQD